MKPTNLIFILSDQHNAAITGCYGNSIVQTPHIDSLAERGTRFASAYTPSPICVPARASLATGRYVHDIGYWENASPYDGAVPSWEHRLKTHGYHVDSIGKLHFRSADDDNGFVESYDAMYVVDGVGDVLSAIRQDAPIRNSRPGIEAASSGDSSYLRYDARIAERACAWLAKHKYDEKPWVLFVSFVLPHPPYIAPQNFHDLYPSDVLPLPLQWRAEDWPRHPVITHMRRSFSFDVPFSEETLRRLNAAYYGMCTYLDEQIGKVLAALDDNDLTAHTRTIYTSDHGEHLGGRGIFGKFSMYDESARVPLIAAGPEIPAGRVVNTPVSLVDCFPTILESVGCSSDVDDHDLPGRSLWEIASSEDTNRTVLSEYHAIGRERASFMLRDQHYKYVYHVDAPEQLFDMQSDPNELTDLAQDSATFNLCQSYEAQLREMLDPEAVDVQAQTEQAARVEQFGGREAVIRRGFFQNSPAPGESASIVRFE